MAVAVREDEEVVSAAAVECVVAGAAFDRFGLRKVLIPAMAILALACLGMASFDGNYAVFAVSLFTVRLMVIPLLLEVLEVRGSRLALVALGPVLVLVGGYLLRQVMMDVGQVSTWTQYESQYDMQLLQRLELYHE